MRIRQTEKLLSSFLIILLAVQPSWPAPVQILVPSTAAPPAQANIVRGQTATFLPDGDWFLLGGEGKNGPLATASVVSARTGKTVLLPRQLLQARAWHTA